MSCAVWSLGVGGVVVVVVVVVSPSQQTVCTFGGASSLLVIVHVTVCGPALDVLRSASATDPELAALWNEYRDGLRGDVATFVGLVAECGPLQVDAETTIDVVSALSGPEMYRALVVERGWTVERFIETMHRLVESFNVPVAGGRGREGTPGA